MKRPRRTWREQLATPVLFQILRCYPEITYPAFNYTGKSRRLWKLQPRTTDKSKTDQCQSICSVSVFYLYKKYTGDEKENQKAFLLYHCDGLQVDG